MDRHFRFLLIGLASLPAVADTVAITLSGNFGPAQSGSSMLDNQNYTINFVVADSALPDSTTCCLFEISATYDVAALALTGRAYGVRVLLLSHVVFATLLGRFAPDDECVIATRLDSSNNGASYSLQTSQTPGTVLIP